ncbi:MAG: hypothetical protein WD688_00565 [Candidatus Binatia bacterium]
MGKMKRKGKTTAHEKTRARQTGTYGEKLRVEQKAAEVSIAALSKGKSVYAARGAVNSCGDWLALTLRGLPDRERLLRFDGVQGLLERKRHTEPAKVDMNRHGAIGRFGMGAGLRLRHYAIKTGFVVIGGKKIAAHGAKKRGRKAKAAEEGS